MSSNKRAMEKMFTASIITFSIKRSLLHFILLNFSIQTLRSEKNTFRRLAQGSLTKRSSRIILISLYFSLGRYSYYPFRNVRNTFNLRSQHIFQHRSLRFTRSSPTTTTTTRLYQFFWLVKKFILF